MSEDNNWVNKLSKIPKAEPGTDLEFAHGIINSILNLMLNKHIHALDENGYLKTRKHSKEYGWNHAIPQKALQMKFDLMDEAIEIFAPQIVEELEKRKK